MKQIDCRTWQCPQPVIEVRKAMLADPALPLEVLLADEAALQNVSRLAENSGYRIEEQDDEGFSRLVLTPSNQTESQTVNAIAGGPTVLFCASDRMGDGDPELGQVLIKNFLITLLDTVEIPDKIYFVNAGVKLTSTNSETVEVLEKLACRGIDIASCGLCLEFYNLKDRLKVGRITNMLEIAEAQLSAGRIIRP